MPKHWVMRLPSLKPADYPSCITISERLWSCVGSCADSASTACSPGWPRGSCMWARPVKDRICRFSGFKHGISGGGWMDRLSAALPTAGIFACSGTAALAQQKISPQRPVVVCYPAWDLAHLENARLKGPAYWRAQLGLPAQAPIVGMVARMERWKGIDVFIKAVARLPVIIPGLLAFVVGGEPIGTRIPVNSTIWRRKTGLGDRLRLGDRPLGGSGRLVLRPRCRQAPRAQNPLAWGSLRLLLCKNPLLPVPWAARRDHPGSSQSSPARPGRRGLVAPPSVFWPTLNSGSHWAEQRTRAPSSFRHKGCCNVWQQISPANLGDRTVKTLVAHISLACSGAKVGATVGVVLALPVSYTMVTENLLLSPCWAFAF